MPPAYLDNAATTRLDDAVLAAMLPWMRDDFGNPSAAHGMGVRARAALDAARLAILAAAGGRLGRVVFTGSGTEANNLAIAGFGARSGDRVIASAVEHPSVRRPCEALAKQFGATFVLAPVDAAGRLDLDRFADLLTPKTTLVALMAVQNELGTIQPIAEAARRIRDASPRAHFHVDAIQALGRIDLAPIAAVADSLALSAHKIHGPKGVGAVVAYTRRPLPPSILGGGQEGGARSGTENVAGDIGFGVAAEISVRELDATRARLAMQRDRIVAALRSIPGCRLLAHATPTAAVSDAIITATLVGLRGETIQHELESRGVVVGTGSACHAATSALSPTFAAIGLDDLTARSMIRVSLSRLTTDAEVERFVAGLAPAVARLHDLVS